MMGVSGSSTAADEAGVFSLMAFLVDKDACSKRFKELTAARKLTVDSEKRAKGASDKLAEAERVMVEKTAVFKDQEAKSLRTHKAVTASQEKLDTARVKLEKDHHVLATAVDVLKVRNEQQDLRNATLNEREDAVAKAEDKAKELAAEYEKKTEGLLSFIKR